jgi:hypothetical protein
MKDLVKYGDELQDVRCRTGSAADCNREVPSRPGFPPGLGRDWV